MLTIRTTWQCKEISIFLFIVDRAGLSQLLPLSATESKLPEKLNGLMSTYHLRFWSPAKLLMTDVMEEMPRTPMNGYQTTTSLMRLAHLIRLTDMIMVLDAQLKLSARTACPTEDAGPSREPKFTESKNSAWSKGKKPWSTKSTKEDLSLVPLPSLLNSKITPEAFSRTKLEDSTKTTTSAWPAGVKKMELNTGSFVIPGEVTGEKTVLSDWSEELTTSTLKETALGPFLLTPGPTMSETSPNWHLKTECQKACSKLRGPPAEESLPNWFLSMWLDLDLMSTSTSRIYLKVGIGGTLVESTTSHGPRINTFLLTAVAAGPREPLVPSLIESTSSETELGLMLPCRLRSSSIAKLEEVATEATLEEFTSTLKITEFLKKAAKTILPRTLTTSVAQTSKNVKIVLIPREPNLETKVIAGLLLATPSGKWPNMVPYQAPTTWKLKYLPEDPSLVVSMLLLNLMPTQEVSSLSPNWFLPSTTRSLLLVGAKKTELNTGSDATVGEHTGEKAVSSASKCTETTWPSRKTALGESPKRILTLLLLTLKNLLLKWPHDLNSLAFKYTFCLPAVLMSIINWKTAYKLWSELSL